MCRFWRTAGKRGCIRCCQGQAGTDRSRSAVEARVSVRVTERQLRLICPSSVSHAAGLYREAFYYSFCEAKASALFLLNFSCHPVRHQFTVAGNRWEIVFWFNFFLLPFLFYDFSNKLLHDVCLKTNCVLFWSMIRRKKITQSIVLISGAPRGLLTMDSMCYHA